MRVSILLILLLAVRPVSAQESVGESFGFPTPPVLTGPKVIALYDTGVGPFLYIGFQQHNYPTEMGLVMVRVGGDTQPLSNPIDWFPMGTVSALEAFDDGTGNALYAGGNFESAGDGAIILNGVARLRGNVWEPVGSPFDTPWAGVTDFVVYDDGSGPELYMSGIAEPEGARRIPYIMRWDGMEWLPVGRVTKKVSKLHVVSIDGQQNLYAAEGCNVTRWNGRSWEVIGTARPQFSRFDSACISSITSFANDPNGDLFVGGSFFSIDGVRTRSIARYSNNTWEGLGAGIFGGNCACPTFPPPAFQYEPPNVSHLETFDCGSGGILMVAGFFDYAGDRTEQAYGRANWDGETWSTVGRDNYQRSGGFHEAGDQFSRTLYEIVGERIITTTCPLGD